MSIARRVTLALSTAATTLSLFAGAAMAEEDYKNCIRIFYETFNQNGSRPHSALSGRTPEEVHPDFDGIRLAA